MRFLVKPPTLSWAAFLSQRVHPHVVDTRWTPQPARDWSHDCILGLSRHDEIDQFANGSAGHKSARLRSPCERIATICKQ
eukprot:5330248-Pyramimonas_sp.AAC.1